MPDVSDDFEVHGEIAKQDDEQQIVFGWAYVSHDAMGVQQIDKSGEFVPDPEELEKAAYQFVLNSRDGGDLHVRKGVSTLVESVVFTKEKCEAMGIPAGTMPTGWWVGFKVHDAEVWKAHKQGQRSSFSIHGKGVRKKVDAS
jgi:hypothetical protein